MKQTYDITNLGCAGCAAKIERESGEVEGVLEFRIDFATSKMHLVLADNADLAQVENEVKVIADKIEPGMSFTRVGSRAREGANKQNPRGLRDFWTDNDNYKTIIKGVGLLLFVGSFLVGDEKQIAGILIVVLAYVLSGWSVLLRAGRNIVRGQFFDENTLMSFATICAIVLGEFREAAAVMIFYEIGEFFQDRAVEKSRKSISALMDLRADFANVERGGVVEKVSPEEVGLFEVIVVKPGERVALDGVVVSGISSADTSSMTGESFPREINPGDEIISGIINLTSTIRIKVSKPYSESASARILALVSEASRKKAKLENFISKFAEKYTKAVVLMAFAIAILPPLLSGSMDFGLWIGRALVFLVASCPCALVISIPLSFFAGIGSAARKGILFKGSNYLEMMARVKAVAFDKTGTLTEGVFAVSFVEAAEGVSETEVLRMAAIAEAHSVHPIALSVVEAYGEDSDISEVETFDEITGFGVKAISNGREILCGSLELMRKNDIVCSVPSREEPCIYVASDGVYKGRIYLSDKIRGDTVGAIKALKMAGVSRTCMITGDRSAPAKSVCEVAGIGECYYGLLPDQKLEVLEKFMSQINGGVAFVGDGINDAPVLSRADVGIAMGGIGTDAAMEAADVVLMSDSLNGVSKAISIAKDTMKIVWQNIFFALGVKLLVLVLGVFGLASMWQAVFADVGVTIIAVFNCLRLMVKRS